jgi:hypothetical protein
MVQPPQPERITQIGETVPDYFALLAGMQLDLFTPLEDGPLTAAELAIALQADAGKLSLLLYTLVVAGLLTVDEGRFSNTAEASTFLVRGKPTYMGSAHTGWTEYVHWCLKTAESVRTGIPQAKHDFAAMSPDELYAFLGRLHPNTLGRGRTMAARYDFGSCRTLLDAGGGSGAISIAMVEAWTQLRATIADLPSVVPVGERFVREAGFADRIDVVAADLTYEAPPGPFDVAILAFLTQVLSATDAQRVLHSVSRSLRPGGTIYLVNVVVDDSRLTPVDAVRINIAFLNIYDDGQPYTEREYRTWLTAAGFEAISREESLGTVALMRAVKSG